MEDLLKIYTERGNNIFQSEIWQSFLKLQGYKTWFITCDDEETLIVKMPLLGQKSYLYVPHGPQTTVAGWHVFLKKAREIAKEENATFVRIEPLEVPKKILRKLKFNKVNKFSPLSHQFSPKDTLFLDISKTEEEILAQMKPKGRYNIKLAERKGVKVRKSQTLEDLKVFYKLSVEMKDRGFSSFDFDHYEKMLKTLGPNNLQIIVAEHEKDILACLLVIYYKDVAIYLHGASGNVKRELMPNHLAQWEAILEAKKKGCKVYDFWGVAPTDDAKHSWSGITRFKKSFGGEQVQFLGAYDFAFNAFWYNMFTLANVLKRTIGK